ncbi:MAG: acyltransferase family protein [Phycisphaeraceae bacterium]|nr:acyltransferase family protein [Phycisphaeraceae bacterium]
MTGTSRIDGCPSPGATAPRLGPMQLVYGDGLRALATLAVVLIHVDVNFGPRFGAAGWFSVLWLKGLAQWCVPGFVMLSGALLLDPARVESAGEFYKRRLWRVGWPAVFWSVFYLGWRKYYMGEQGLGAQRMADDLLRGRANYHLYFLFLIVGIYLFVPMLRAWVRAEEAAGMPDRTGKPGRQERVLAAGLLGLGLAVAANLAAGYRGEGGWALPVHPTIFSEFVPYVGYFLLGYALRDVRLGARGYWLAAVVLVACVEGTTLGHTWLCSWRMEDMGQRFFRGYLSPFIVGMALSVYVLLAGGVGPRAAGAMERMGLGAVGRNSLGIYLVHIAVIDVLKWHEWIPQWECRPAVMAAVTLEVVAISWALVWVTRRIPLVRGVVGIGG